MPDWVFPHLFHRIKMSWGRCVWIGTYENTHSHTQTIQSSRLHCFTKKETKKRYLNGYDLSISMLQCCNIDTQNRPISSSIAACSTQRVQDLRPADCALKATLEQRWKSSPLLDAVWRDLPHWLQIFLSGFSTNRKQNMTALGLK